MPAFVAPIDPAHWTLSTPEVAEVPATLRYAGRPAFVLRADSNSPESVAVPAPGILRQVVLSTPPEVGTVAVEVQVNPFAARTIATAIPFGLATFYFLFAAGSAVTPFDDGDAAAPGDPLATVTTVRILCVGQDRLARDPALWSAQILAAIPPADAGAWAPFAAAVAAQTAAGANPPVRLLDHRGAPRGNLTTVEIVSGTTTATAVMTDTDGGDLQRTVARMHAADPQTMPLAHVFDASGRATLRPQPPGNGDFQLARLEDAGQPDAVTEIGRAHV